MYGIGDKVVYGAFGVMEIVDITEQTIGDTPRQYYVMKEYSSQSPSLTYVPLENEMLVAQMQPLLSKDEIPAVIRKAKQMAPLEWIEDNRARSESYKKILSSADRATLIAMIETVYRTGIRREEEGKKNYIADENIMKKAQKIINEEFSIVLGIPEDDVVEFIKNIK